MSTQLVWIYDAAPTGGFPFIGAVKMPDGKVKIEPFATRDQAVRWTEDTVRDLMIPPGEKR